MTLQEALKKGTEILKSVNIEAPAFEAGVILCHAVNCDRVFLYSHGDTVLEAGKEESYLKLIGQRAERVPLQYVTGHQEFMSLDFDVGPGVLVPRQDTETLVEVVIREAEENKLRILELGTGSGCIAISLAYRLNSCLVTAVDISAEALKVAAKNAVKAGVDGRVAFIRGNLFDSLDPKEPFDIIVSNPPYIPSKDIGMLQPEVREFEPRLALDGGSDGLDFYRDIVAGSAGFLKTGGLLAFEVGCGQAKDVAALMSGSYLNVKICKDLARVDRVVTGRLKPST